MALLALDFPDSTFHGHLHKTTTNSLNLEKDVVFKLKSVETFAGIPCQSAKKWPLSDCLEFRNRALFDISTEKSKRDKYLYLSHPNSQLCGEGQGRTIPPL